MTLAALLPRYGTPTETWHSPARQNVVLYVWNLGGVSTDLYVVKGAILYIDGRAGGWTWVTPGAYRTQPDGGKAGVGGGVPVIAVGNPGTGRPIRSPPSVPLKS